MPTLTTAFILSFALVSFTPLGPVLAHETFTVDGHTYSFTIQPEHPQGYLRSDWSHWDEHIGGGCFTVRDKVLAEESFEPVITLPASNGRCRVTTGRWNDPYTGHTFTASTQVQIDHVVPLKEAHDSGGHAWTNQRRREYANDLSFAGHLIAVQGSENGSKGPDDPADYLPIAAFRCEYVANWIKIKDRWRLNMNQAEADAIRSVLAGC